MPGMRSRQELPSYYSSVLTYCLIKFLLLNAKSSPSSPLYHAMKRKLGTSKEDQYYPQSAYNAIF